MNEVGWRVNKPSVKEAGNWNISSIVWTATSCWHKQLGKILRIEPYQPSKLCKWFRLGYLLAYLKHVKTTHILEERLGNQTWHILNTSGHCSAPNFWGISAFVKIFYWRLMVDSWFTEKEMVGRFSSPKIKHILSCESKQSKRWIWKIYEYIPHLFQVFEASQMVWSNKKTINRAKLGTFS